MKTEVTYALSINLNRRSLYFVLVLLLCSVVQLNAQYIPFNTEDASWKIRVSKSYCPDGDCGFIEYRIEGTTSLNGKTYGQVFLYTQEPFEPEISREYFGGIRNSIGEKRLYSIRKGQSKEEILYDFNIALNDTIAILHDTAIVVSIDSVLVGTSYNRRYNLESIFSVHPYYYEPYSIMEGVGSTNGLFEKVSTYDVNFDGSELVCYKEKNIRHYPASSDADCESLVSSIEGNSNSGRLSIFPNPAKGHCIINNSPPGALCQIYNISGMLAESTTLYDSEQRIDLSAFPAGVYLVKITTKSKFYATQLLRIE